MANSQKSPQRTSARSKKGTSKNNKKKDKKLSFQEFVEDIKKFLQGSIAIGIVILLAAKLLYHADRSFTLEFFRPSDYFILLLRLPTLELVGKALAYSAGVDLAYMLFTPGPDEAIEPLILGLASAILFSISRISDTNIDLALEIGLYVIILSGLFFVKTLFIPKEDNKKDHDLIAFVKMKFTDFVTRMKITLGIK